MAILGVPTGFALYFAALFIAVDRLSQPTPSFAEAIAQAQQMPSRLIVAVIPFGLGLLCTAVGLVLVVANLLIHFMGTPEVQDAGLFTNAAPPPQLAPSAPSPPHDDDSRYMPKPR
jgi:hypothetical protein